MKFIAELCQNHNGDFGIVKEMVYAAHDAGADYVKLQTIFADMLTFRERFEIGSVVGENKESIKRPYKLEYDRLKALELSYAQQAEFVTLCISIGIKPLTTVFNRLSVPDIHKIGFNSVKVASYDCGSVRLLEDLRNSFDEIFVSTGASYDEEIAAAAKALEGMVFSFLHCVTIYPTPLKDFNLARMKYLRQFTPTVGWSDHSLVSRDGLKGTMAAIYFGADIIERHVTILESDQTKDGPVSIFPKQIEELKYFASLESPDQSKYLEEIFPNYQSTIGHFDRQLTSVELANRDYYRGRFANFSSVDDVFYNWE
jgi:sialic acid synthase SpsE